MVILHDATTDEGRDASDAIVFDISSQASRSKLLNAFDVPSVPRGVGSDPSTSVLVNVPEEPLQALRTVRQ